MVDLVDTIFRDFEIDGVPSSGAHKPNKAKIREWGTDKETRLTEVEADVAAETVARQGADTSLDTRLDAVEAIATAGIVWKASVRVATTANATLASGFENGDTIDGTVLATGNRILIKDQSAGAENGIYIVNASGGPTRATDADTEAELLRAGVFVEVGTANAGTTWVQQVPAPITVNTTALTFAKVNDQGATNAKTSEAIRAVNEMAGNASLTDKGVNNDTITATNITDGATPAYTVSHEAAGLQIALTTTARNILFSTRHALGPLGKTKIKYTATCTFASACYTGLSFGDGVDREEVYITNAGAILCTADNIPSAFVVSSGASFATGAVITMELLLDHEAETLWGEVSIDGGAPYLFSGTGIPIGTISYFQRGNSTVIHVLELEAINDTTIKQIASHSDPDIDALDRNNIAGLMGLLASMERVKPAGFTPTITDQHKFYLNAATYFSSLNLKCPLDPNDPTVSVLWIDAAAGDDANPGSYAEPLETIQLALGRCQTDSRVILYIKGDFGWTTGWRSNAPKSKNLAVIAYDTPSIVSMEDTSLTWALGAAGTYSATFADGISNVWDADDPTSDGDYGRLTVAASQVACEATIRTYFIDGTTLYVHAFDGRSPDSDIKVYKKSASGTTNNINVRYEVLGGEIYLENILCEGGVSPFFNRLSDPAYAQVVRAKNCTFKYGANDNFDINGDTFVLLQNCITAWAAQDGYNYHAIFASAAPHVIEIDCVARWCGTDNAGTNNGSTMHDSGWIVRVNGDYHHNADRNVHDITGSFSWNLGCTARDCQTADSNFCSGLGAESPGTKMWLDGCTSSGSQKDLEASTNSTVYHFNLTTDGDNLAGGTITTYTP